MRTGPARRRTDRASHRPPRRDHQAGHTRSATRSSPPPWTPRAATQRPRGCQPRRPANHDALRPWPPVAGPPRHLHRGDTPTDRSRIRERSAPRLPGVVSSIRHVGDVCRDRSSWRTLAPSRGLNSGAAHSCSVDRSDRRGGSVRSGLAAAGGGSTACITWQLGATRHKGPPES
jgi:hypothetical protein